MSSDDDQSALATPDEGDNEVREQSGHMRLNGASRQDVDSADEEAINTPNSGDDADLFGSDAGGDDLEKPVYGADSPVFAVTC